MQGTSGDTESQPERISVAGLAHVRRTRTQSGQKGHAGGSEEQPGTTRTRVRRWASAGWPTGWPPDRHGHEREERHTGSLSGE